jgi:hypothetical protein
MEFFFYHSDFKPNDIKMDLKEIGWVGIEWINLAQEGNRWRALVSTVMYRQVQYSGISL